MLVGACLQVYCGETYIVEKLLNDRTVAQKLITSPYITH